MRWASVAYREKKSRIGIVKYQYSVNRYKDRSYCWHDDLCCIKAHVDVLKMH